MLHQHKSIVRRQTLRRLQCYQTVVNSLQHMLCLVAPLVKLIFRCQTLRRLQCYQTVVKTSHHMLHQHRITLRSHPCIEHQQLKTLSGLTIIKSIFRRQTLRRLQCYQTVVNTSHHMLCLAATLVKLIFRCQTLHRLQCYQMVVNTSHHMLQ
jgi:hypothetical protein